MQTHPSRMQDDRPRASDYADSHRRRSRSRSPPPHQQQQRHSRGTSPPAGDRGDRRASPVYESYDRVERARDDERRNQDEANRRERDEQRREREDRDRDRERRGIEKERRATPDRELGNGQGGRGGYQQGGGGGGGQRGPGGGDDWFEQRRKERDNSHVNIWPASPKAPARELSPVGGGRKSSSRKHKSSKSRRHRHDSVSTDSETDSDDDRRRSSKKHRSSKHHSSSKHHKSSKSRSSRKREHGSGDDDGDDRASRSGSAGAVAVRPRADEDDDDEDMWVEKEVAPVLDDDDEEVGPLPLHLQGQKGGRNAYGGALLKGEGSAMAAFVENGERIPRRGEIGMESSQIEMFETMGYVMSGSRHRRMNAVRVRKENQVISAEEKRGILKMQAEEKAKRENQIVASFKEIVDQKLAGARG
ncbi:hypothetical protein RQP46_006040 [Phenoliferia psychrophenolica]